MGFLDFLKGRLFDIPDRINRRFEPYDEFNRPPCIIDHRSLKTKDRQFWREIQDDFRHGEAGESYVYASPFDGGDSAFFQGWYAAACAFRKDWSALQQALTGIEKLVTVGKDNRLSRGVDVIGGRMAVGDRNRKYYRDGKYIYHQDCSESSLIGILLAVWATHCTNAPRPLLQRASTVLDTLAQQIIKDDYRLMNEDGTPAKFGDMRPRLGTAPIRLGTLAAMLLLAHVVTSRGGYRDRYEWIANTSMGSLTHLETHFLWFAYPRYQTVLAYVVYTILAQLDHRRATTFRGALGGLWRRTRREGNSLYAYMARMAGLEVGKKYLNQAEKTLREFNSDKRLGRLAKEPGGVDLRGSRWDTGMNLQRRIFGRKRKATARQPVPIHLRPSADFFWQRSPYDLYGHSDHDYNSLDFCLAYSMGVKQGVL